MEYSMKCRSTDSDVSTVWVSDRVPDDVDGMQAPYLEIDSINITTTNYDCKREMR